MNRIVLLLGILLMGAIVFSCAPKVTTTEKPAELAAPVTKTGWEAEWERMFKAAQRENKVVITGGTGAAVLKDAIDPVAKKYGLKLEITAATGPEIRAKVFAERKAGLYTVDIILTGHTTLFTLKHEGVIDPMEPWLVSPEVTDPKAWFGGKLPWADKEKHLFNVAIYPTPMIAVNNNLVQMEEIKSLYDLLNPKWKGKMIVLDPTVSGQAWAYFTSLLYNKIVDLDYFRELVNQQPMLTRDLRLAVDWLAKGKYPITLWPTDAYIREYMEAGAAISALELKEGTLVGSTGSALTLVNRRPHPNAAGIFINWLLGREGSTLWQNARGTQVARMDVPSEKLHPLYIRKTDGKYYEQATTKEEFILQEEEKYTRWVREIFAPLIK